MLEAIKTQMTTFAQTASGLFKTAKPAPKPQNSFFTDLKQAFIGIPKQQEVVYVRRQWIPFLNRAEMRDIAKTKRQIVLSYAINRYTAGTVIALFAYYVNAQLNELQAEIIKINVPHYLENRNKVINKLNLTSDKQMQLIEKTNEITAVLEIQMRCTILGFLATSIAVYRLAKR